MDKKNLQVIVLVLILVGVLIAAVSFLVGKYEKEASNSNFAAPAVQIAPVKLASPEAKVEEPQDLPQPGDEQFPTEKGKFLR
jgi:hypothetical protein